MKIRLLVAQLGLAAGTELSVDESKSTSTFYHASHNARGFHVQRHHAEEIPANDSPATSLPVPDMPVPPRFLEDMSKDELEHFAKVVYDTDLDKRRSVERLIDDINSLQGEAQVPQELLDMDETQLSASEAVYGALSALTLRKEAITLGAEHDVAPAVEFAREFCDTHGLPELRHGWNHNLLPIPEGPKDHPELPIDDTPSEQKEPTSDPAPDKDL